jgi:hypothetical protein
VLDDGEDVLAPPGQGDRLDEVAHQQRAGVELPQADEPPVELIVRGSTAPPPRRSRTVHRTA